MKTSRLFEIIQLLRHSRKPVTALQLSSQLEVSIRSIYRDMASLQAMRVPISGDRGVGYILRPGYDLPPLMFSPEEIEAITLGMALIKRTGDVHLVTASIKSSVKLQP